MAQNEIKFVNEANLRRYTKKVKTADDAASRTVESEATGSGTTGEFPLHLNHTAYSSSNPSATATKDKVYIDNNLRYNPVTHELKITDGTNTATFSPTGGDAGDFTGTTTVGITAGTSSAAPKVKVKVGSSDEATSGEITKATTGVWGVTKLLGSITTSTTQPPTSGAVKTELDKKVDSTALAAHTGTSDGSTLVGYSSSETGYTGVTTVDGALDQIITDLAKKEDKTFIINATGNLNGGDITINNPSKTYTEIREASTERTVVVRIILRHPGGGGDFTVLVPLVSVLSGTLCFGAFLEDKTFVYLECTSSDNWNGYFLHDYGYTDGANITFTPQLGDVTIISALDEKVNQTATTANSDIPMLLANGTTPSNGGAQYDTDLKYNPSTNTLKLGTGTLTATNYSGTSAKATADGSGNNIVSTYATKSALDALTQKWTGQFVVLKSTGDTAEKYTALNNILAAIAAGQTPAAADLAKLDLGYIYLLENGSGTNVYDEYIKVAKGTSPETYSVEKIGTTDAGVDVVSLTDAEIDSIWANPDAA